MKSIEDIGMVGILTIFLGHGDGRRTKFFEEENLIVKEAKRFLLSGLYLPAIALICGAGVPFNSIKFMIIYLACKDSGVIKTAITIPITANRDITNLA